MKDQQQVQLEPKVAAEKKVLFAMWRPFTFNVCEKLEKKLF
jgi:hypothetical protein